MRIGYVPNERVVNRAVQLWKKMLESPVYDNGDKSMSGAMCMGLAHMLPNNSSPENLSVFGDELKKILMTEDKYGFPSILDVDYVPCSELALAAEKSGIKTEFPWKTTMWLYDNRLSLSGGYAAECVMHYPLPDGKWLVTRLAGSDISKVIEYVLGGKPEFIIEKE